MLRGRFRLMVTSRTFGLAASWIQQHRYAGMANEVLARARFTQERLASMTASGVRQVVILGAGFDGTAWLPGLPTDMIIYEVDRPETQTLKRARLAQAGLVEPERLVFISADLLEDELRPKLSLAGFDTRRAALVIALGLLMYLPRPSVEALLGEIGATFAPGSERLYTFFSRYMLDRRQSPAGVRRGARRLARKGEPFLFAADPVEMSAMARRAGLRQVENLDGVKLTSRYFAARGDRRTIEAGVNLARAVTDPSLS